MSSPDALLVEARRTTRRVSRTFGLAARLLPADVRDDVFRLYLVFRTLDDLVDDGDPGAEAAVAAVERWAAGGRAGGGGSREAHVLADIDARIPLPRQAFTDFCRGMRRDLTGEPIRSEAELDDYCYCVAGTVGLVMAAVLGTDSDADAAAAALGCAMQRTNILRDIDEDTAAGRTYLPGLTDGDRIALVREQIARADALYDEGVAGIRHLRRGRAAIRAAAVMYREILRQIERNGYAPGRATVSASRKIRLAASVLR